ncbi:MAG: chemotaxis protein CheW [Planctomycetes bacterium]|nr:chemotaxis protein CheW [Planctomycetota bacterium]
MQLLTLTVEAEAYAIESRQVVEVLPLVPARPIPRMPDYVRGIFIHRGRLVPLIDLGLRLADHPPAALLSTRVIVVEYLPVQTGADHAPIRLGIVAENVVSFCSDADAEAFLPGMHMPSAPYLGRLLRIGGRTIQLIRVEHLLPGELVAGLVNLDASLVPAASSS